MYLYRLYSTLDIKIHMYISVAPIWDFVDIPITDIGYYFQADKGSRSDIAQHVHLVAIFTRTLTMKGQFNLFIAAVLL